MAKLYNNLGALLDLIPHLFFTNHHNIMSQTVKCETEPL